MTKPNLPAWWTWVPAGVLDAPICAVEAVYRDCECVASVACYGEDGDADSWEFTICQRNLIIESIGHASRDEAKLACERMYLAAMAARDGGGT